MVTSRNRDPRDARGQSAAQRCAVFPPDPARRRGSYRRTTTRARNGPRGAAMCSKNRLRPASTSLMTASSSGSVSRLTCHSAMSGFAGDRSAAGGRDYEAFQPWSKVLKQRFPTAQQDAGCSRGRKAKCAMSTPPLSRRKSTACNARRRRSAASPSAGFHDRALAGHHLHHDAERPLRVARRVPGGAGQRDAQRVSGDPPLRPGCCRSIRPTWRWTAPCSTVTYPTPSSWPASRSTWTPSTRPSKASRAIASGCIAAGATGTGRTIYDVALELILPVLYQANVGALSSRARQPAPSA